MSCRDGWHRGRTVAFGRIVVKYDHGRRYDEVIRYVWRNPRRAKNGKKVVFRGQGTRVSGNGRRRRSLLLFTAALCLCFCLCLCLCLSLVPFLSFSRTWERRAVRVPIGGGSSASFSFAPLSLSLCLLRPCSWARHLTCCRALCGCVEGLRRFLQSHPQSRLFKGTSITRYSYFDTYRQCLRLHLKKA